MSKESEIDRRRSYQQFEELGEAEVERGVHLGEWLTDPRMQVWAQAWLREQQMNRDSRAVHAAVTTARSTKATAILVAVATALAAGSLAWSVWGP